MVGSFEERLLVILNEGTPSSIPTVSIESWHYDDVSRIIDELVRQRARLSNGNPSLDNFTVLMRLNRSSEMYGLMDDDEFGDDEPVLFISGATPVRLRPIGTETIGWMAECLMVHGRNMSAQYIVRQWQ